MSEWRSATVAELEKEHVLLVQDGNHGNDRPLSHEFTSVGTPFIRAADIRDGRALISEASRINESALARIRKGHGRAGDTLFSHKGTVGKIAYIPEGAEPFVCSPQTTFWRSTDQSVLNPRFLPYVLASPDVVSQVDSIKGETDMAPYVSLTQQRQLRVAFPSLPEQTAICDVLGALDDKIAANARAAGAAEAVLRAEIDQMWLTRDDRSASIADYLELNPPVPMPQADSAIYIDMKRLPESGWSIDGFDMRPPKGGARFLNGDTLLARITPCLENRKTGYVDQLESGQVAVGSTEFIVLRSRAGVAAPLSFLLATAPRFRDFAIQHMVGTSGRQRVAASDLAEYRIPNPEPAWLQDFGDRAIRLFETVASQTRENRTLAATRDALLPQLMSGKLRVRDAEAIAADAGA